MDADWTGPWWGFFSGRRLWRLERESAVRSSAWLSCTEWLDTRSENPELHSFPVREERESVSAWSSPALCAPLNRASDRTAQECVGLFVLERRSCGLNPFPRNGHNTWLIHRTKRYFFQTLVRFKHLTERTPSVKHHLLLLLLNS